MKAKKGNKLKRWKENGMEKITSEKFDADKVKFDNPQTRLEQMQEN